MVFVFKVAEGLKVNFNDVFLIMYIWSSREGFYERERDSTSLYIYIYIHTFPRKKKSEKILKVNRQEV